MTGEPLYRDGHEIVTADGRLTADGAAYLLGEPPFERCTCPDCHALPLAERERAGHGLRAALAREDGPEAIEP